MTSSDFSADSPAVDWRQAVQCLHGREGDVLPFSDLRPGDRLQVMTRHTLYDFTWQDPADQSAELRTNRSDRPMGPVRVIGCAYGAGTTIAPGRLFTGGSLEFTSQGGCKVHRTTAIAWIRLLRQFAS